MNPIPLIAAAGLVSLTTFSALGLGGDYQDGTFLSQPSWPSGMPNLVNVTNRIGGLFVNAEDRFFFSGTASDFSAFLKLYCDVRPIRKHLVILHEGAGEAYSLGGGNKRSCDWSLEGRPGRWHDLRAAITNQVFDTNYVLEVHFWTAGKIALDRVTVPKNIEFEGDCLKVFEAITNGMTRAEVEKSFTLDGGLQTASPVRYLHPSCPLFKVDVEFEFKRDAADQNRAITGANDKVIRVSKPYLQRIFAD